MKMRWEFLSLVALWLIVVYSYASPIKQVGDTVDQKTVESNIPAAPVIVNNEKERKETLDGRQARQQTPAPEDDDDDDDDDDDLDVDLDDDDDDDDDDASPAAAADDDDDDDDDYFGGLFDDILGDDDDDDDEDETPTVQQPVAQPAEPVVPDDVAEDIQEEGVTDGTPGESLDSDLVDKDPAASAEQSVQNLVVQQPIVVQPVPAAAEEDDDDDDDDDDDELDELTGDDDDDDDDDDSDAPGTAADEDDDDDDDDDDELDDLTDGGIIDARKARALSTDPVTAAKYVSKYNRFVDNIISRVNRILRRSYDPVRVKLSSTSSSNKSKTKKKKNSPRQPLKSAASSRKSMDLISSQEEVVRKSRDLQVVPTISTMEERANKKQNTKEKQKPKVKQTKPSQKARATLYGLSSIKREGDVAVNLMSDHTTVRTNFAVGPLTLRVEKEFGKGARRELKSATATTAEMRGKLSLRVSNDGQAKLHSIRVLQPKQVRVESPDEHDRTREFIWRRSSNIAHLVSQKLATATRSMLKPSTKSLEATKPQ